MAQESNSAVLEAKSSLTISNGRSFQELNDAYKLPTDSGEHSRLDLQHEAVKPMLGGSIYQTPELVKASLVITGESQTSGARLFFNYIRAIDVAEEFPHADVLGIDLVMPNVLTDSSRLVPSNCSFRVADANKDMGKIDLTYDLIQLRLVGTGIHDWDLFLFEAARVIRPGGILLLVGAGPQLVDWKGKIIPLQKPGDEGYSQFQHIVSCMWDVQVKPGLIRLWQPFWKRRASFFTGRTPVKQAFDIDFFTSPSILENNPNYNNVRSQEVLAPVGPWPDNLSDTKQKLAETMQQNLLRILPAYKAILLRDKRFPEEFVNSLAEGAMKEIREHSQAVHGYSKWVFATAVRTETPWVARPDPWQEPEGYDMYDYIRKE